jgi:hypothetical protein
MLGSLLEFRIGQQAVNQRLAARALERADRDAQPRRQFVDHLVGRVRSRAKR